MVGAGLDHPLGAGGWVFVAATALAVANLATGMVQQRRAVWLGWLLVLPVGSLVLHEAAAVAPPGIRHPSRCWCWSPYCWWHCSWRRRR